MMNLSEWQLACDLAPKDANLFIAFAGLWSTLKVPMPFHADVTIANSSAIILSMI
jgi:hypothetical protein